jgi:hypothetical protein
MEVQMKLKHKLFIVVVVGVLLTVTAGVVSADLGGTFNSPLPEPTAPPVVTPTPEPPVIILPGTGAESPLAQLGVWLLELWGLGGVRAIVAQIVLNVVLAVAASIHQDKFDLRKIGEFLYRKVLPYVAVYVTVKATGMAAGAEWLAPVVYAAIFATLTGDMLDNLVKLGLKVPDGVQRLLLSK